jgi:hypothetical protein
MDGLDGDHVVTPTVTSRNNRGAVFVCVVGVEGL